MSKATKKSEVMDESFVENREPVVHTNHRRNAYALVQLVDEVRHLFPETSYEFANYNGRNTAMSVAFDTSDLESEDAVTFHQLLALTKSDSRILDVTADDSNGLVLVDLFPSARHQDSREPFGLNDAYMVLVGEGS